jgi:hypothetical protein
VVAGGERHHAAGPLGRREAGEGVVGAAELERPGPLEILTLEEDACADAMVDGA